MIKCISYWSTKDGLAGKTPIDEALKVVKEAGFAGMELCMGTDGVLTTSATQAECEAIRKKVDASGLVVETLASGMCWGFNPTSNDPAVLEQIDRWLREAGTSPVAPARGGP